MIDARDERRKEYTGRINRVMDYITMNLAGDLSLRTLARVANFSPYHFHRLFRGMVGETVNGFIRRVRVEGAASKLLGNPTLSITRVATDCGFASPSSFAREFRAFFGMSATEFRAGGFHAWSKNRQTKSKSSQLLGNAGKDSGGTSAYTEAGTQPEQRRQTMKMTVEVKEMPELFVAYVRHIGPYNQIPKAIERIMKWAGPRGLVRFPQTQILGVYHDDPEITEVSKLRSSACITVPKGTKVDGEVGTMTIPGGRFAVAHCEIDADEYGAAWDKLMGEWLPESGYQPDDRLCYEIYLNDPTTNPQRKHIVDICEPVKPL
jgi:AraC family transcriptional regulator